MDGEVKASLGRDVLALAKERVQIGAVPEWVVPCPYAKDFKAKVSAPATHLLIDRQVQAEFRQTFTRMAVRLETMKAVQHHSQWRLEFSPQVQSIVLHSIKVIRGDIETEHGVLDRIQFLRREAGLEGFVIDGWVTLLLLLEDVRPGDVLEWSYTIHSEAHIVPNSFSALYSIPEGVQLAKHHLAVQFAEARTLKWKSSSAEFTPIEQRENGAVRWQWLTENYCGLEPETNRPAWYVGHPWIQISDCAGWQVVATGISNAWKKEGGTDALEAQVQAIREAESELPQQVARAIQFVQDEFRYFSVNVELGGQVPADCDTVIRRRYGDCKDVAFLLAQILCRLGVKASAVLVHSVLRKWIKDMLPSPVLFNHIVVQYELAGKTRWVDATIKAQGGNALNRTIPDYGFGLVIDPASTDLTKPPADSLQPGVFELNESFLLDTAGGSSRVAVTVTATGVYAESMRTQFNNESLESIAKQRLESCVRRFSQATRVGSLQYRDDREANRFVLAEVFEINGFLLTRGTPGFCWFRISNCANAGMLPPFRAGETRRSPLALPYPSNVIHTVEIESNGLAAAAISGRRFENSFFEFTCSGRGVNKFTKATFSMRTFADAVYPEQLSDYRAQLEQVLPWTGLEVRLPHGFRRMRTTSGFGALPAPGNVPSAQASAPRPESPVAVTSRDKPSPGIAVVNPVPQGSVNELRAAAEQTVLLDSNPNRRRSSRSRHRQQRRSWEGLKRSEVLWILAFVAGMAVLVGLLMMIGRASRPY